MLIQPKIKCSTKDIYSKVKKFSKKKKFNKNIIKSKNKFLNFYLKIEMIYNLLLKKNILSIKKIIKRY